ncbi:CoA transferase [Cupriavidus basilensis]
MLDLSQGIAGPYCGLILRQQGARVIKVEPPSGDWGPPDGPRARRADGDRHRLQRRQGKRGARHAHGGRGKAALRKLAEQADVIIQNYRPGVAARMGRRV